MTTAAAVLAMVSDPELHDEVERIVAAAGSRAVHISAATALTRSSWASAGAVILDRSAAVDCHEAGRPRRSGVFLVTREDTAGESVAAAVFGAALAVGAERVVRVPAESAELVGALSALGDTALSAAGPGPVIAVVGGRGGAGASVFAAAMALTDTGSLLLDLDAYGGGIDLLLGAEAVSGLRWPDIGLQDGRIGWSAIRAALPAHRGITLLAAARHGHDIAPAAVDAILDAGRRGAATVVCDVPRQFCEVTTVAVQAADLVALVTPCDVRSCAAAGALAPALSAVNPNVGLVVRGPSPGGLRATELTEIVGVPLLAAMRPEPMLAEKLETGGLRLGRRSPLAVAARQVRALLGSSPAVAA